MTQQTQTIEIFWTATEYLETITCRSQAMVDFMLKQLHESNTHMFARVTVK